MNLFESNSRNRTGEEICPKRAWVMDAIAEETTSGGTVNENQSQALRFHLSRCDSCRRLVKEIEGVGASLTSLFSSEPPSGLEQSAIERTMEALWDGARLTGRVKFDEAEEPSAPYSISRTTARVRRYAQAAMIGIALIGAAWVAMSVLSNSKPIAGVDRGGSVGDEAWKIPVERDEVITPDDAKLTGVPSGESPEPEDGERSHPHGRGSERLVGDSQRLDGGSDSTQVRGEPVPESGEKSASRGLEGDGSKKSRSASVRICNSRSFDDPGTCEDRDSVPRAMMLPRRSETGLPWLGWFDKGGAILSTDSAPDTRK